MQFRSLLPAAQPAVAEAPAAPAEAPGAEEAAADAVAAAAPVIEFFLNLPSFLALLILATLFLLVAQLIYRPR